MKDILYQYIELLWNTFQYDVDVFSQAWMYYWLLIPAIGYFVFFILKWIVLTAPIWIPIKLIIQPVKFLFGGRR